MNVQFNTVYLLNHEGRVIDIVGCSSLEGAEHLKRFFDFMLEHTEEPLYVLDKPQTEAWKIARVEACHD